MKQFKIDIKRFILFGFNKSNMKGGANDIIFQSDDYDDITHFIKISNKNFYHILDIDQNELYVIDEDKSESMIVNQDNILIDDEVWCMIPGLPIGTVVSELENEYEVLILDEKQLIKKNRCFRNI